MVANKPIKKIKPVPSNPKGVCLHINNDNGIAIITVLLLLALLTLVSISATDITVIEKLIVRSEAIFEQNFYEAESAVMEACQVLEDETNNDQLRAARTTNTWLQSDDDDVLILSNPNNWNIVTATTSSLDPGDLSITYFVIDRGIVTGAKASSVKMTGTSVHKYEAYGNATHQNTSKVIQMGCKKRF